MTFDELTSEDLFKPGITSVVQPAFQIGARAVEVLLRRIRKGVTHTGVEKVGMRAELLIRESSANPAPQLLTK